MENHPVLCGGTLLTLIWESLKEEVADKENPEIKNAPTLPEFYKDLIACVGAETDGSGSTFKTYLSKYKNCNMNDGKGLVITGSAFRDNFENDFKLNRNLYSTLIKEFVERYIDEAGANQLLWRLAALIEEDESIKPGEVGKGKFQNRTEPIFLPNLLMNALKFIILNRPNNMEGKETISDWYQKEYSNAKGVFSGSLNVEPYKHLRAADKETEGLIDDLFDFDYHPTDPWFDYHNDMNNPAAYLYEDQGGCVSGPDMLQENEEPQNPIKVYLEKAKKRYFTAKTLLYLHSPMPFYDFYETADIRKAGSNGNPVISSIDAVKLQDLEPYMVIYGTGGLGKSMMLRHLFLSSIDQFNEIRKLPVFISLKDYKNPTEKLLSFCFHQIEAISNIDYEVFIEMMASGKVVFFFDGYDELKSSFVEKFDQQLNDMITKYPDNRYVMSSRPMSSFIQLDKFTLYDLMPLTQEQAIKMVERQKYDPELKKRLVSEMQTGLYETHKAFIENPLLLMILLITYNVYGKLPTSRSGFYEKVFNALLFEHDSNKIGFDRQWHSGLGEKDFREMFTLFCIQTYSDEEYEFNRSYFLETLRYIRETVPLKKEFDPESFIFDCEHNLCLIIKDGQNYHFIHRSFQEFFAGVFLAEQADEESIFEDMEQISRLHEESAMNVFRFAHELNYKKIEKYGFIPYLEDLLGGLEFEEGYEEFLENLFPRFTFSVGETEGECQAEPEYDPLYGIIREITDIPYKCYGEKETIGEDDIPFHVDFITESYGYYTVLNGNFDLDRDFGIIYEDQLESYIDLDYVGYEISIKTRDIFKHPDRYPEIYATFMDDEFKPRQEFLVAKEYLRKLKKDHGRSRSALLESRKKKI